MSSLLQKLGLTLNDIVKSTLTLFLYFAFIAAVVLWLLPALGFKIKVSVWTIGGFALGAFYFLFVNEKNNGGSQGDQVAPGGLNDILANEQKTNPYAGALENTDAILGALKAEGL